MKYEGCFTLENIEIKFHFALYDNTEFNIKFKNLHSKSCGSDNDIKQKRTNCIAQVQQLGLNSIETKELLFLWHTQIMNIFNFKNQPAGQEIILLPENIKLWQQQQPAAENNNNMTCKEYIAIEIFPSLRIITFSRFKLATNYYYEKIACIELNCHQIQKICTIIDSFNCFIEKLSSIKMSEK
jgi:hypothetical protein